MAAEMSARMASRADRVESCSSALNCSCSEERMVSALARVASGQAVELGLQTRSARSRSRTSVRWACRRISSELSAEPRRQRADLARRPRARRSRTWPADRRARGRSRRWPRSAGARSRQAARRERSSVGARELLADIAGARLGLVERAFEARRIAAQHAVDVLGLGRESLSSVSRQLHLAVLQGLVDAVVGRLQRVGRPHDRLALLVEAVGDARDLIDQVLRHVLEQVGLAGEPLDRLQRLLGDVLAGAAHGIARRA